MARPTKLTPELIGKIEEALSVGMSRARACSLAGISLDSLSRWINADPDLADLIEKAEAKGEYEHLKNIRDIAFGEKRGDWKASAWLLARKYPSRYSENQSIDPEEPRLLDATAIAKEINRQEQERLQLK